MQEHTEILETTPARGSAQSASAPTAGVAATHTTATSYDPHAGRRAGSTRLVQTVYLVFGLIRARPKLANLR